MAVEYSLRGWRRTKFLSGRLYDNELKKEVLELDQRLNLYLLFDRCAVLDKSPNTTKLSFFYR